MIKALESGDYDEFSVNSKNSLEPVTSGEYKEIEEYKDLMKKEGAFFSMMTGSGPTVFGLFKEKEMAEKAAFKLKEKTDEVYVIFL